MFKNHARKMKKEGKNGSLKIMFFRIVFCSFGLILPLKN